MTINNLWLQRDRALVGADSEGRDDQGAVMACCKMFPIVHQNAVLTGSGAAAFGGILWGFAHALGGDFDHLLANLPEMVRESYKKMRAIAAEHGLRIQNPEQQSAVAVGWSSSRGRMVAHLYSQPDEATGFQFTEIPDGGYIQPAIPDPPRPSTLPMMGRLAQEQVYIIREQHQHIHAGGKFVVAEITRNVMTIRTACELQQVKAAA